MSVIRRCSSCGTSQATGGECTTCHEADVHYFCTNHDPGRWLTGPSCPQCAVRPAPPPLPVPRAPAPTPAPRSDVAPRAIPPSRPVVADVDERPALWETVVRSAALARRGSESVTRASSWLSKLVMRFVLIALVLGIGLVVLLYAVARSLG